MHGRDLSHFYSLFGPQTVFLPVPYGSKRCTTKAWQHTTWLQTQESTYQKSLLEGNLAVSVGPASADLVSIDLDLQELGMLLVRLNPVLAQTLCTQGAKGCNLWLRMIGDYPRVIRRFDPRKKFGEWRGGGGYTVVDGRHPDGPNYRVLVPNPPIALSYPQLVWPEIFDHPDLTPEQTQLERPTWMNDNRLPTDDLLRPDALIEGLLHRRNKMILSGGSKTYKTWTLIDLAVSLAFGGSWLGFQCHPCRVLYINFEIQTPFFMERVNAIKGVKKLPQNDNFLIWFLRGFAGQIDEIIADMLSRLNASGEHFDVVIWDPIYKTYGDYVENDAGDMARVMNEIDSFSLKTDTANILGHHFSKGNQAGRDAIDRISGSGVFGRDPDSILTITPHEQKHAFVIDLILRNNLEVDSFGVRWDYPLLVPDHSLDPEGIKKPGGAPRIGSTSELLELLRSHDDQLSTTAWQKLAASELGYSESTFYRFKRRLLDAKAIFLSKSSDHWNVK